MGMEPAAAAFRGLWLLKAKQPRQDHERPISSSTGLKSSHGSWQGSDTSPGWEKGWVSLAHRHVAKESGSPSTRASVWPGIDGAGGEAEPHEPENGRSWGTGTWARARWCCPRRGCNVAGSCERWRLLNASQEGQEDVVPPRVLSASSTGRDGSFQVPARCFSPWDAVQGVNKVFSPDNLGFWRMEWCVQDAQGLAHLIPIRLCRSGSSSREHNQWLGCKNLG